jgi:hypothetical protein
MISIEVFSSFSTNIKKSAILRELIGDKIWQWACGGTMWLRDWADGLENDPLTRAISRWLNPFQQGDGH